MSNNMYLLFVTVIIYPDVMISFFLSGFMAHLHVPPFYKFVPMSGHHINLSLDVSHQSDRKKIQNHRIALNK